MALVTNICAGGTCCAPALLDPSVCTRQLFLRRFSSLSPARRPRHEPTAKASGAAGAMNKDWTSTGIEWFESLACPVGFGYRWSDESFALKLVLRLAWLTAPRLKLASNLAHPRFPPTARGCTAVRRSACCATWNFISSLQLCGWQMSTDSKYYHVFHMSAGMRDYRLEVLPCLFRGVKRHHAFRRSAHPGSKSNTPFPPSSWTCAVWGSGSTVFDLLRHFVCEPAAGASHASKFTGWAPCLQVCLFRKIAGTTGELSLSKIAKIGWTEAGGLCGRDWQSV